MESTHIEAMSESELGQYRAQIAALPPMIAGESLDHDSNNQEDPPKLVRPDGCTDDGDDGDNEDEDMFQYANTENMSAVEREQHMFEVYMNSTDMAENSYNDVGRKYKCHKCKLSYTKQDYIILHNRSGLHRKNCEKMNFAMEKFKDPNRPYKCNTCKESFTQKNILLVHYNSVSHLHKLKQDGVDVPVSPPSESPTSSSSTLSPSSPVSTSSNINNNNDPDKKPYRCNICKVAYGQGSNLDIHIRSVLHQTRTSKLHELALCGQIDLSQPLIEQPEATATTTQHKKLLAEMLTQKHSIGSMMASIPPTGFKGLQLPLLPPTTTAAAITSSSVTKPFAVMASAGKDSKEDEKNEQRTELTCHRCAVLFSSPLELVTHQQMHCIPQPHLSTPVIRGNRLVARYQPQLQHSLLQNFGFEMVMQYNENRQKIIKKEDEKLEEKLEEKDEHDDTSNDSTDKSENELVNQENKGMPDIMKSKCPECSKEFSSVWVLKTHQEEIHNNVVPCKLIQEYSEKFKDDYAKNHPIESRPSSESATPVSNTANAKGELSREKSTTPAKSAAPDSSVDNSAPSTPTTPIDLMTAQMMQMPMFGMMPMPLGMNMVPPLMPMMMPMGGDFTLPGFPCMPPMMDPAMFAAAQQHTQQQHQAAAAAVQAQQQKRARTRISDDQLKILRTYFDINNSPSEVQIIEMAEKSNLPAKVIKHWFRNTLFKERQRNKDSPYNFSIPPSTPLNLEEYEKNCKVNTHDLLSDSKSSLSDSKIKEEETVQPKFESVEPIDTRHTPDRESVISQEGSMNSSTPSTSASSTPALPMPPTPSFILNSNFSAAAASHQELVSALTSAPFVPPAMAPNDIGMSMSNSYLSQMHNSGSGPKRANRTRFSDYQIQVLQEFFDQNAYPKDDDLDHMSKVLNLNPRVIVVWFQNARQKARKSYENQPPVEVEVEVEDENSKSPFQRTPGLNYQCKKCLTVFQRYYELIKHQKNHCFKDSPNSINTGNSNNSNSEINDQMSTSSSSPPTHFTATSPLTSHSTNSQKVIDIRPLTPKSNSTADDALLNFKCEKCHLNFQRLDLWQEHQNVHAMNPNLFSPYAPDSAFAMLQSVAQHHTPNVKDENTPDITFGVCNKRKAEEDFDEEDDSNSSSEQQRDKRLRTTILPEQLDYLYQKYSLDCNPSRKQLDAISEEVGLKKRVVQVMLVYNY